ncbi:MAG: hypothetical protein C0621_10530 [Desulfuromonas sp.]|nr:MAG: hypothetical protein C0621_10530 [Desulfuromonas sp.]
MRQGCPQSFGKIVSWFLALFCLAGVAQAAEQEIDAETLNLMMGRGEVLVVFPLSPIEFNNLHIAGSVNIPLEYLEERLPADKNQPIAFYCLGRT